MDASSNLDKEISKDSWRTSLSTSGTSELILTATSETVLTGVSGESAMGESGSVGRWSQWRPLVVTGEEGWGRGWEIVAFASSICTRDKSRDNGGLRKGGKARDSEGIDFRWTGTRTGLQLL
jgi:hypothetical protein